MFLISVERSFSAAHYLRGYGGKCENMHGHRYRVIARLALDGLNEIGIAFDFGDLKRLLDEILADFDHKCLNDIRPFDDVNPSAENIAVEIYGKLKKQLGADAILNDVEVWESPDTCAVYRPH
jgi:6-pyruvoyltetrahydropterin/6-carboxytetrahydropterin synthase